MVDQKTKNYKRLLYLTTILAAIVYLRWSWWLYHDVSEKLLWPILSLFIFIFCVQIYTGDYWLKQHKKTPVEVLQVKKSSFWILEWRVKNYMTFCISVKSVLVLNAPMYSLFRTTIVFSRGHYIPSTLAQIL